MKRLKARPMPPVPPTMATFSPLRSRLAASMRRHVKLLSRFIESESLSRPLPPTDVRRSNHQRTPTPGLCRPLGPGFRPAERRGPRGVDVEVFALEIGYDQQVL